MAANINPIYTLTPNIGRVKIPTTYACTRSDGGSTATGVDFLVRAFTTGTNGSYVDKIRFTPVASAANTNSVATVLRIFISTVSGGATTPSDTYMIGEIQVPIIAADVSNATSNFYEVPFGSTIPSGTFIHVSQHLAQTTNQWWQALVFGGDY